MRLYDVNCYNYKKAGKQIKRHVYMNASSKCDIYISSALFYVYLFGKYENIAIHFHSDQTKEVIKRELM